MAQLEAYYSYDGSFPGLLCVSARLQPQGAWKNAVLRPAPARDQSLFEELSDLAIDTDETLARDFWKSLSRRCGRDCPRFAFDAHASDISSLDSALLHYLCACQSLGRDIQGDIGDPEVLSLYKAAKRSRSEAHLFLGLVRFRHLADGSWYAPIQPSCDILALLEGHFSKRYPAMDWVIHDTARGKGLFHASSGETSVSDIQAIEGLDLALLLEQGDIPAQALAKGEAESQAAFKRYFSSITIQQRKNPRLQASHMPKKYWKYLIET